MTRSVSAVILGIAASFALVALGGCAPMPPDAWRLEPIRHDNRSDGEIGPARFTDVTFAMRLTPDTAGGFWGESAGSWLHLDADGTALRRFDLGLDAPNPIYGISALTPTRLLVSAPAEGASGAIHLFDTATGSWETVYREIGILGDLAVRGDDVYIVEFAHEGRSGTFTVRRLDLRAPDSLVDASPPLPVPAGGSWLHDAVAIDVGPDGTLFLATSSERITVGPDGQVLERVPRETPYPLVAVGPEGTAVWSGGRVSTDEVPFRLTGGSAEAREVLAQIGCSGDALEVASGVSGLTLPFLCAPRGIAWLDPHAFVVSVGGESGAVLVRVDAPAA